MSQIALFKINFLKHLLCIVGVFFVVDASAQTFSFRWDNSAKVIANRCSIE